MSAVFCSSSANAFEHEDGDVLVIDNFIQTRNILPNIITQPENYYGYLGDNFTFTITAENVTSYQWIYSTDGINYYNSTISGNKTNTLSGRINENRLTYYFKCRVYNGSAYVDSDIVRIIEKFTILDSIQWLGNNLFTQLFNFSTPWGITFGALIVGVFGVPLLVKAYKKFF